MSLIYFYSLRIQCVGQTLFLQDNLYNYLFLDLRIIREFEEILIVWNLNSYWGGSDGSLLWVL